MSVSIVIADDHAVVRTGLSSLLENTEIQVVGEAEDGSQAIAQTLEHSPDVVLMDIRMGGTDGLEALEKIREQSPNTRVIILSNYDNPTYVARSVALGANDYVLKSSTRDELLSSIRRAARGEPPLDKSILEKVRRSMARRREGVGEDVPLTNRETQVLRHIALGLSNREIASSLSISVETVKEHVQNILRKINASDRTQAAVWAVKKGLVET
ncbi:MAG: response regulator transcription factor [Planctomycetaceae bacterium]|nr:response regulator transcription factor [Planctomycetaceae bacterium]